MTREKFARKINSALALSKDGHFAKADALFARIAAAADNPDRDNALQAALVTHLTNRGFGAVVTPVF